MLPPTPSSPPPTTTTTFHAGGEAVAQMKHPRFGLALAAEEGEEPLALTIGWDRPCWRVGVGGGGKQLHRRGWCSQTAGRRRSKLTRVLVANSAWPDPLISQVQGWNRPSVPGPRFRGVPAKPPSLRALEVGEEQKVTFQLRCLRVGELP